MNGRAGLGKSLVSCIGGAVATVPRIAFPAACQVVHDISGLSAACGTYEARFIDVCRNDST